METATTTTISALIDSSPFWSSFLSQLLATLIVVVIGSVIVPPILRWNQRAQLKFFVTNTRGKTEFEFTKAEDGQWETTLHLSIFNIGKKTIDRFYWEMYMEKGINVDFQHAEPFPNNHTFRRQDGDQYARRYGFVQMPIFPLDDIDFVYEIKIKVPNRRQIKIFYYFRTDLGESPIWARLALVFRRHYLLKSLTIR